MTTTNLNSKKIVSISGDPRFRASVDLVSNTTNTGVLHFASCSECMQQGFNEPHVVLIDAATLHSEIETDSLEKICSSHAVILYVAHDPDAAISLISKHRNLDHVISTNLLPHETLVGCTIDLLRASAKAPLSVYLGDAAIHKQTLTQYAEGKSVIEKLRSCAKECGSFPELSNLISTAASEMLMNAFFDAPRDRSSGLAVNASRPRSENVVLTKGDMVAVTWGFNADLFGFSITDPFGSLTREHLSTYLGRSNRRGNDQIIRETHGAGVGLYMLFHSASQIDFKVNPGKSTEVVAVFSLNKRQRDFEMRGHALNFVAA